MANLIERHQRDIRGVLSCLDRVVIQGTIPSICYPKAMATMLDSRGIRLFDYTQFVQPFRDAIRAHAEKIAAEEGVTVEYIRKMKTFRKEDRIREILTKRGEHPGLVHIFSAMEPCSSYEPWHDKATGNTFLRRDTGKCLHYYFYFIDEVLGLCFLAVPTWCPFRALFYSNGHNWLASKLRKAKIVFELNDNAFADVSDWQKAQDLSDALMVTELHARMDAAVERYCPVLEQLGRYHWSIMQVEYATDIVFRSAATLAPLYDHLLRTPEQPTTATSTSSPPSTIRLRASRRSRRSPSRSSNVTIATAALTSSMTTIRRSSRSSVAASSSSTAFATAVCENT